MSGDRLAKIERACHARIADKDLAPQLRGEARDVLALVEIARAARDIPDMDTPETDALYRALARLDSDATPPRMTLEPDPADWKPLSPDAAPVDDPFRQLGGSGTAEEDA